MRKLFRAMLLFAIFPLLLPCCGIDAKALPGAGNIAGKSEVPHGREAKFRAALVANGFIVNDGYTYPIDLIKELFDSGIGDSASANNGTQLYKAMEIPQSPEVEGGMPIEVFRLRPDEAIVYVGPTPPRCDYFSFTPYLYVRRQPIPRLGMLKGDWVFAAVNDPLNNGLIKTEGNGDPFHKQTIVIFTADRGVYQRVAALAQAAGYPESMINSYVIPSALLYLGVFPESPTSDSLVIAIRTANFTSAAEGDNYLRDNFYAGIWRVTPKAPAALDPFDTPPPRNRKWISEASLFPELQSGLERLRTAIVNQTPHQGEVQQFESMRWWPASRDVLAENDPVSPLYHQFIAGEASDTPYLRTAKDNAPANFVLGNDDMVVVYGVNHAATGLATYSSFVVYGDWIPSSCDTTEHVWEYVFGCGDPIWNGVAGKNSHDFSGSAEQYIPGDPMAPYLYAVKVLREPPANKHEKYWVVVPETAPEGMSPNHGISLDKPIIIGYRAYLNPATNAGPDYDDIIWDRAIWFKLQ